MVSSRIPEDIVEAIDAWATRNDATRSTAIRRLVEIGLKAALTGRPSARTAARAAELASKVIDGHVKGAPAEERDVRKRRILKGPSAFRDVRIDRKKSDK